jgi:hypothetical protein
MPYYKFLKTDVFFNRLQTHPRCEFLIYSGSTVYNKQISHGGEHTTNVNHVPSGHINLYEINVDRSSGSMVYPFITKEGSLSAFRTMSTDAFHSGIAYGDTMVGSYPLSASISKERFAQGQARPHINALRNALDSYGMHSRQYAYSSSFGDKSDQELGLLSVPSIFYGSAIKKGSVSLKFYITGSLIAELQDKYKNGELIEVTGSNTGKTAGVALYNEGFLVLTGSWDISDGQHTELYIAGGTPVVPKWSYFGQSISGSITAPSSSFNLTFKGTNYIPTVTMHAHAKRGRLNHSNNKTYIDNDQSTTPMVTSGSYREEPEMSIKNVVSSSFPDQTGSFQKQTYISKVGVYDEEKNLIAIAKLATPVRKREIDELTFKLRLDF